LTYVIQFRVFRQNWICRAGELKIQLTQIFQHLMIGKSVKTGARLPTSVLRYVSTQPPWETILPITLMVHSTVP